MLTAKEYYQILLFLDTETVDRYYPVEEYFYSLDEEGNRVSIVYEDDSFLFKTNRETFVGFDYVEVLLETSNVYNSTDLTLCLSEYSQGYDPLISIIADDRGELPVNTPVRVIFKIEKSKKFSETSRNFTNIKSIELITPCNSDFKIHDICFRDNNAILTLEQLDNFYEKGRYYIYSRLHMSDVPEELVDHIYTASAGYAWMSIWEYESRVMNDEQKNAKSYGKWLFAVVDDAINQYKISHGIADDDEKFVKDDIVTVAPLRY